MCRRHPAGCFGIASGQLPSEAKRILNNLKKKLNKLRRILLKLESVLIAFSGGLDSTFLLKIAKDTLDEKVAAVTAKSKTYLPSELKAAKEIARDLGIRHIIIETQELSLRDFKNNSPKRCYFCKKELFSKLKKLASRRGLKHVVDASNYDDLSDFRPGRRAAREFRVRSPLEESGFRKEDIRKVSKEMGLSVWNKPSGACLASRIPYGEKISIEKLKRIEKAEEFLKSLGLYQLRVRDHGDIARIEVLKQDMLLLLKRNVKAKIIKKLNDLGYRYITLDLEGYCTGSMNKTLAGR